MSNTSDDIPLEVLLELEEELIDSFTERTFEELLSILKEIQKELLNDIELFQGALKDDPDNAKDTAYSIFRVMKAILAEIEYRLKENKI